MTIRDIYKFELTLHPNRSPVCVVKMDAYAGQEHTVVVRVVVYWDSAFTY
jgi:hypothetical protein